VIGWLSYRVYRGKIPLVFLNTKSGSEKSWVRVEFVSFSRIERDFPLSAPGARTPNTRLGKKRWREIKEEVNSRSSHLPIKKEVGGTSKKCTFSYF